VKRVEAPGIEARSDSRLIGVSVGGDHHETKRALDTRGCFLPLWLRRAPSVQVQLKPSKMRSSASGTRTGTPRARPRCSPSSGAPLEAASPSRSIARGAPRDPGARRVRVVRPVRCRRPSGEQPPSTCRARCRCSWLHARGSRRRATSRAPGGSSTWRCPASGREAPGRAGSTASTPLRRRFEILRPRARADEDRALIAPGCGPDRHFTARSASSFAASMNRRSGGERCARLGKYRKKPGTVGA